jgi:hypothetical protein
MIPRGSDFSLLTSRFVFNFGVRVRGSGFEVRVFRGDLPWIPGSNDEPLNREAEHEPETEHELKK